MLCLGSAVMGCEVPDGFSDGFRVAEELVTEVWTQPEATSVDVLWVVDTSCSMMQEQTSLTTHFPAFAQFFLDLRLPVHLAVTSTNIEEGDTQGLDGHLNGDPRWLTLDTPDLVEAFSERALMGIDIRHNKERGLHASYVALETLGETDNGGFLRDDADLVVVVVSDEPDYSTLGRPDSSEYISSEDYSQWLEAFKGSPGRAQLSAIVGFSPEHFEDPGGCTSNKLDKGEDISRLNGALRGDGYIETALDTGGSILSICSDDWSELLARLGMTAAGLQDTFHLSDRPDLHSIRVVVDGSLTMRWSYADDVNAIVFDLGAIPESGQEISIRYQPGDEQEAS